VQVYAGFTSCETRTGAQTPRWSRATWALYGARGHVLHTLRHTRVRADEKSANPGSWRASRAPLPRHRGSSRSAVGRFAGWTIRAFNADARWTTWRHCSNPSHKVRFPLPMAACGYGHRKRPARRAETRCRTGHGGPSYAPTCVRDRPRVRKKAASPHSAAGSSMARLTRPNCRESRPGHLTLAPGHGRLLFGSASCNACGWPRKLEFSLLFGVR